MMYCAIDPGLQGAVVCIDENNEIRTKIKIPVIKNSGGKTEINIKELVRILEAIGKIDVLVLEKVHSMPGQGISSSFSFGKGCGIIEGILTTLKIPYLLITPQAWQKEIFEGINRGGESKQASILVAERLFPTADFKATERSKIVDSNITDATCMAVYAKRKMI